jgi:hypothetical protein
MCKATKVGHNLLNIMLNITTSITEQQRDPGPYLPFNAKLGDSIALQPLQLTRLCCIAADVQRISSTTKSLFGGSLNPMPRQVNGIGQSLQTSTAVSGLCYAIP